MSARESHLHLSRRERQIMDVIYARGSATVQDVVGQIPDPPSYSAVRAMWRVLEEKGHVRHKEDGPRYVYLPTVPRDEARQSALRQLVRTFFENRDIGYGSVISIILIVIVLVILLLIRALQKMVVGDIEEY